VDRARLARYSLVGGALRAGRSGSLAAELAALRLSGRIRQALEEPADAERLPEPAPARRMFPYAMAAGVALVALAVLPFLRFADGLTGPTIAQRGPAPGVLVEPVAAERRTSLSPARLTNYLVYHGEYSGTLSAKVADSHIVNQPPYVAAAWAIDQSPGR
jgi:hypothetical protein